MSVCCVPGSEFAAGRARRSTTVARQSSRYRQHFTAAAVLLISVALCSCGRASPVVRRPAAPIYDRLVACEYNPNRPAGWICPPHFDLRHLLGLSTAAASTRAKEHALEIRVVERDGRGLVLERDTVTNRVNVVVVDGIVTAIQSVG